MDNLDIVWKDISEISPYPKNTKKHDKTQIKNVAESIKEFGWRQPIVVDANGVIVIGHCRYLAAKRLKLSKVPVHVADLSEEKAKKLRIVDNKSNESEWDFDFLKDELDDLDMSNFDFEFNIEEEEEKEVEEDNYNVDAVPELQ